MSPGHLHLDRFNSLHLSENQKTTRRVVFWFWSRIRESNPPSRLGKPLYYRYTNPALCGYYSKAEIKFQYLFCRRAKTTQTLSKPPGRFQSIQNVLLIPALQRRILSVNEQRRLRHAADIGIAFNPIFLILHIGPAGSRAAGLSCHADHCDRPSRPGSPVCFGSAVHGPDPAVSADRSPG